MLPHEAEFHTSPILDFQPPVPPDVVLALHACDTATDQALAVGIKQVWLSAGFRARKAGGAALRVLTMHVDSLSGIRTFRHIPHRSFAGRLHHHGRPVLPQAPS